MLKGLVLSVTSVLCFLCACNSGRTEGASAPISAEARQGEHIFKANCAVCHYADTTGPLHGPGLKGIYKRQALPSGVPVSDAHVRMTIVNGRAMMPPFGNILDEVQVNDLLAYLKTI